ncbi:MAG: HTH domain-containing protein [Bacilli bacterium]
MNRKYRIIEILQQAEGYVNAAELADCLGVTTRTIRSDIQEIKRENGDDVLCTSKRYGYKWNPASGKVFSFLYEAQTSDKTKRMLIILKRLIVSKAGVDLAALADELYHADSTIESDFTYIKKFIEKNSSKSMKIVRRGNRMVLESDVVERVSLLFHFFAEQYNRTELRFFQSVFEGHDLRAIYRTVKECITPYHTTMPHASVTELTLEVVLMEELQWVMSEHECSEEDEMFVKQIALCLKEQNGMNLSSETKRYLKMRFEKYVKLQQLKQSIRRHGGRSDYFAAIWMAKLERFGMPVNQWNTDRGRSLQKEMMCTLKLALVRRQLALFEENPLRKTIYEVNYMMVARLSAIVADMGFQLSMNDLTLIVPYLTRIADDAFTAEFDTLRIGLVAPVSHSNIIYLEDVIRRIVRAYPHEILGYATVDEMPGEQFDMIISTDNFALRYPQAIAINKYVNIEDVVHIQHNIERMRDEKYRNTYKQMAEQFISNSFIASKVHVTDEEQLLDYVYRKLQKRNMLNDQNYAQWRARQLNQRSPFTTGVAIIHTFGQKNGVGLIKLKENISWSNSRVRYILIVTEATPSCSTLYFTTLINQMCLKKYVSEKLKKCTDVSALCALIESEMFERLNN